MPGHLFDVPDLPGVQPHAPAQEWIHHMAHSKGPKNTEPQTCIGCGKTVIWSLLMPRNSASFCSEVCERKGPMTV